MPHIEHLAYFLTAQHGLPSFLLEEFPIYEAWREKEPISHSRSPKGQVVTFPASLAERGSHRTRFRQPEDSESVTSGSGEAAAAIVAKSASKAARAATAQTGVSVSSGHGGGLGGWQQHPSHSSSVT